MTSPLFRWVVERPTSLGELLGQHGLGAALSDGRVFVDGKRGTMDGALAAGAVVEVFAPRSRSAIEVLFEGDGVFAVHKPAALPTEPAHSGADCVLAQLAKLLRVEPDGLFAVSRLDVGVSGVLLVALGARSRKLLLEERAGGRLRRRYVALASAVPTPAEGEWRDSLGAAGGGRRQVDGHAAKPAHTHYRVVATARSVAQGPPTALLALSPVTGRTHQLRVHAAAHGAPLLGDRKYGGPPRMTARDGSVHAFAQILLHATWVEWESDAQLRRVTCEPAPALLEAWTALGGDLGALQLALD